MIKIENRNRIDEDKEQERKKGKRLETQLQQDNHWPLRRPALTDGKSVWKPWAEFFSNKGVFGYKWKC